MGRKGRENGEVSVCHLLRHGRGHVAAQKKRPIPEPDRASNTAHKLLSYNDFNVNKRLLTRSVLRKEF